MRVVIALGGNALLRRGDRMESDIQRRNIQTAAAAIAVIAREHRVVVTHGNGPQIGLLALQAQAYRAVRPYPLDVLGAESEGMIGYLLEQSLANQIPKRNVATLLTQVVIDPNDPAFANPTKPIGPVYGARQAAQLRKQFGWTVALDGAHHRRVVASPAPKRIIEIAAIRHLFDAGIVVVCAGGGGIPVMITKERTIWGVEAVIDKDSSAALLAKEVDADVLLLLTDVDAVQDGWGTPRARAIRSAAPGQLSRMSFEAGSMGPKIEAACRFARAKGKTAAIGSLRDAARILRGEAGTVIRRGTPRLVYHDTG
jgi:carbamate kinase